MSSFFSYIFGFENLNTQPCIDQEDPVWDTIPTIRAKTQKYRGMPETQKSGVKTSSGEIDLKIITLASPKVGQDQVSGGVSVLCWHYTNLKI